jgi:hypothetical protein
VPVFSRGRAIPALAAKNASAMGHGSFDETHTEKAKIIARMIVTIQNARSYFSGIRRRISALSPNDNAKLDQIIFCYEFLRWLFAAMNKDFLA